MPARFVAAFALAAQLVSPTSVAGQEPAVSDGATTLLPHDGTGDLHDPTTGEPPEGAGYLDVTIVRVWMSDGRLGFDVEVAEPIPLIVPDGLSLLYGVQVDTNGDSQADYSVDIGSTDEGWILSAYDLNRDDVAGQPGGPVVEGTSPPTGDPFDYTFWADKVPDRPDEWHALSGQFPQPSVAPSSPSPSGALSWCTTSPCGPEGWPLSDRKHLYAVTFSTFRDDAPSATYHVYTDRGPLKAVSIATSVHESRVPWPIFDIEVVDIGREARCPSPTRSTTTVTSTDGRSPGVARHTHADPPEPGWPATGRRRPGT